MKIKTAVCFIISCLVLNAGIARAGARSESDSQAVLRGLEKLRQQLTPFDQISVEYTVERQKGGTWTLWSRHQLNQDLRGCAFKEKSVTDFSVTDGGDFVLYKEMACKDYATRIFEAGVPRVPGLDIAKSGKGAIGNGTLLAKSRSSSFSAFLAFYDIGIFDAIEKHRGKETLVLDLKNGIATVVFKRTGLCLEFDVETGILSRKITGVYDGKSGVFEKHEEFIIQKTATVEGRQVPVDFIWKRHMNDKITEQLHVVANPATMRFAFRMIDFDLELKFPAGTIVHDAGAYKSYRASELDGPEGYKDSKEALDALVGKAREADQ
jgi:hypothetical protein